MAVGEDPAMPEVLGIDHVAVVAADLEAFCAYYDRLFGIRTHGDFVRDGRSLVRQVLIGGALISVHQAGNGTEPVALRPTVGSADICFRWSDDVETAIAHLQAHDVQIIAGPAPRRTADGMRAQSVYFRDPDQNLIELICAG
jgi:catechol 2,3-dioxygenase-like lactoylglutathione lyase family enzyme